MNKKDHAIDITKLSRPELEDLIAREQKLLTNKSFIARLPDKGSKIRQFYAKLCSEHEKHCNIEPLENLLSNMQITTSEGLNSLEWTKQDIYDTQLNRKTRNHDTSEPQLNGNNKANQISSSIENQVKSIFNEPDLNIANDELDVYCKNIITFDTSKQIGDVHKFKPFYTTKTDVHNPIKEKGRKRLTEEITSATPPALQHEKTVKLSLYDSIQLQIKQNQNLQKIQQHNAVERLQRLNKIFNNHGLNSNTSINPNDPKFSTKYRDGNTSDSEASCTESYDSELEAHDDDEPRSGGVNIVVYSQDTE